MIFGSLDGRKNGEHMGVGVMQISKIYVMQSVVFFGTDLFDSV